MAKHVHLYALLIFISCTLCEGQNKTILPQDNTKPVTKEATTSTGPKTITRTIRQDSKGNIWIAAFDGIFRYDGKSFTNITSGVSSARFFSVLEDRKGYLWFGSIGSGVFRYDPRRVDGQSFQNFTMKDGLLNNEVLDIYEDKKGNIWLGVSGGASRYDPSRADGKSFQNFIINGDAMNEDRTGQTFPERAPYGVNSIVEDKKGKLWFATRGNTFVYDGKTFTPVAQNGEPFTNVRTLIEDHKGNIWLAGEEGLWRFDGSTYTNVRKNFVGYIIEDKRGNIWTSSENANEAGWAQGWALSRYDADSLSNKKPTVTIIESEHEYIKKMMFGILEAHDGTIWFGALDGVYRYDGKTIRDSQGKEVKE